MSYMDRLNGDMKQAMRQKEKQKLTVIRMLKSSLQNEEIKQGSPLSDEDALTVISREMKQRNDSLREFEQAGRDDLVEKTKAEIRILQEYMPEQLTVEEIKEIVTQAVDEVGATSKADMGKVMGAVMPKVKGKADGNLVRQVVQEQLP